MQGIVEFLKTLSPGRIAAMGAVTLLLIGFFAFVMLRVSAPQMGPLFTDLTLNDSAAIVKELESQGVTYELKGDGSTIMVERELIPRLRMKLAEGGLPSGGGVGYEIFDKTDALSSTSFLQNVNNLRAMEGELARSIRSIDRVRQARVHLVIPERALFQRDAQPPSASIVVGTAGELEAGQIRAIRHLVATAVEGLKPERISIVDESGRLLADGANGEDAATGAADERLVAIERRLKGQIEGIVERIVGPGRARAEVRAELDFNKITATSEAFDPESKVVRSTQTKEENSETTQDTGEVTVGNNVPNANQNNPQPRNLERSTKSDEVINYEISRTTRTEVLEGGRMKRVTVAVLVDGVYAKNAQGDVVYEPRAQEELDRIAALVRSAIGFDEKRGDHVEVVNLRFADQPSAATIESSEEPAFLGFTKSDLMWGVELGVLFILAVLVLLLVVRPLVRRAIGPDPKVLPAPSELPALPGMTTEEEEAAAAAEGGLPAAVDSPPLVAEPGKAVKMIELAQVNGQIAAQSIQRVGDLVKQNPHETVQILRSWINGAV